MATKTTITWEEFVSAGEQWQRWEWIDSEIVYMTPVNFEHEIALAQLVAYLVECCRVHPGWVCVCSNAAFHSVLRQLAAAGCFARQNGPFTHG
jgi:Uma2 family endonuclease